MIYPNSAPQPSDPYYGLAKLDPASWRPAHFDPDHNQQHQGLLTEAGGDAKMLGLLSMKDDLLSGSPSASELQQLRPIVSGLNHFIQVRQNFLLEGNPPDLWTPGK